MNIEIYSPLLNNKQIKDAEFEVTERKEERRRNTGGGGPEIYITCAPILFRLNIYNATSNNSEVLISSVRNSSVTLTTDITTGADPDGGSEDTSVFLS